MCHGKFTTKLRTTVPKKDSDLVTCQPRVAPLSPHTVSKEDRVGGPLASEVNSWLHCLACGCGARVESGEGVLGLEEARRAWVPGAFSP